MTSNKYLWPVICLNKNNILEPAYIHIQSCVSQSGWRDPVLRLVAWVERLADGIFPQQPFHPHKLAHLLIADAHLHRQLHISQCGQCKSVQTDTKRELTRVLKQICLGQTELQPLRFITFQALCQCRVKGFNFTETLKCLIILSLMVVKCSPNSKTSMEYFFIPYTSRKEQYCGQLVFHSSRTRVRETGSSVQRCNVASLKGRTGGLRDIFWLIEAVLHTSKPLSTYTHRADAFTGNKFCQKRSVCNVHISHRNGYHAQDVKTDCEILVMLGLLHLENLQRVYIQWVTLEKSKSASVFIHRH